LLKMLGRLASYANGVTCGQEKKFHGQPARTGFIKSSIGRT
jgi:hypothetical protein